jgi:hypothetical protein
MWEALREALDEEMERGTPVAVISPAGAIVDGRALGAATMFLMNNARVEHAHSPQASCWTAATIGAAVGQVCRLPPCICRTEMVLPAGRNES